ncbi:MAG: 2-oxo acid dehydrogenase subunit E2, partial [Hyphomonadaceae bacterium]
MTEIVVPTLGESVTEATVARWLKKPGETVAKDETLVELETDKVSVEVSAPEAGVLSDIVAAEGDTVGIGALLGHLGAGAAAGAKPAQKAAEQKAAEPKKAEAAIAVETRQPPKAQQANVQSPSVQRIAAESGIDLAGVQGSGRDGRITKGDAMTALATRPSTPVPVQAPRAIGPREERVRMTRLRQTIARRLKEAQNTAAMLTTFNEADMSAIMAARNKYKDGFERKHGVKLGFMSFFVKACVQALKEIPNVNAEIDGDDIIYKN